MLFKYILLKMINLGILNIKKLNKELKENNLSNIVDIEFWKKIIIEEKKLAKTYSFDNNKIKKIILKN